MKVRAKSLVYYGDMRRREGEVFELKPFKMKGKDGKVVEISAEQQFTEEFMEKVDPKATVRRGKNPPKRSDLFPPKPARDARDANAPRPVDPDADAEGEEDAGQSESVI